LASEAGAQSAEAVAAQPIEEADIQQLCELAVRQRASDLHITVGLPPMLRIDGRLRRTNFTELTPHDTRRLMYDIMNDVQIQKFESQHELDFSYGVRGVGRFRVNVYMQRDAVAAALRAIPHAIPSFEELHLPPILRSITTRNSGLILVTGVTGSGKSTTIACMLDYINENRNVHIITIEDPIEYLHRHKQAMVNQREMGSDTFAFDTALRSVLREDPDVVLIGEMRDLETIEAALVIGETGHLVFGTLHTRNSSQTVDRIVDVFPPHQQAQVRVQLANTLEAVISQQLVPRMAGGGRLPAVEVMLATGAIRNLIREAKTHQMPNVIETSGEVGMVTMDMSLCDLVLRGEIAHEEALLRCIDADNLQRLLVGRYQ